MTEREDCAIEALRLVLGRDIQRIAIVADTFENTKSYFRRRVLVKSNRESRPVPLKSFGDGAVRVFEVAMAIANSRNGFLAIDEVENGIHYSLQRDFWKMVLQLSNRNNTQVFATTHSWDCVAGFARAMEDSGEVCGSLVRIDRIDDHTEGVDYSWDDLQTVARDGIEVR